MVTRGNEKNVVLPEFGRAFFTARDRSTGIGDGEIGGKARGLMFLEDLLQKQAGLRIDIPAFTVLRTGVFDRFMILNGFRDLPFSSMSDDEIAIKFQQGNLPVSILGDLRALVMEVRTPLAVRSSSLLEDSLKEPFAGIYETKMIPNNQHDPDERFRKLVEAVKLVFATTFFQRARDYLAATGHTPEEERMAVVIQEVVGQRFGDRFYPVISGVCRSHNFYPVGRARPEEGTVSLALGLGKTIVDGERCWTYCPAHPLIAPPVSSPAEMLDTTQKDFWAVNMGKPPAYDPIRETEYLVKASLGGAEEDGNLKYLASTYDPHAQRVTMGIADSGPRILDFALLLRTREFAINEAITGILEVSQKALGSPVELEFAATLDPPRLGFLQVRPMMVSSDTVEITDEDWQHPRILASSTSVLGNGTNETIRDIVFVKPATFEQRHSPRIALELENINRTFLANKRKYLLIGFGRWGSSEPWLGIPVNWGQISAAGAIIETGNTGQTVELSQGSHFFHNLLSFKVSYFSIAASTGDRIEWNWLESLPAVTETSFVKCVRLAAPLLIKVDGRTGRGVVFFPETAQG